MNRYPEVYIVILNFNSYEETVECIESLHKIKYENYKIVIVDNDSKDDSYRILKTKYPQHVVIQSGKNLGYANGNNIGIKFALEKGAEYICLLNNDVIVEENFLEPIIQVLQSKDDIKIAGPCICEYNDKTIVQAMGANINLYTGLAQGKYKGLQYKSIKHENIEVDYLGGACFVCKAQVFKKVGLIPENYFLFFEETEFCLNAKRNKFKLVCVYESKVYHKRSATISKFKGLSYFFLNRNRVIFIRRNANFIQKIIFSIYIFIEAMGRILLRREPVELIKFYLQGFKADINKIDFESINKYI